MSDFENEGRMSSTRLTQFYDTLKSRLNDDNPNPTGLVKVTSGGLTGMNHPGAVRWRNIACRECDKLKDGCHRKILLDIYCKILPLDQDYIDGNQAQMQSDIDSMLDSKGMTATQYITSCKESTNAPLLEFVINAVNMIGRTFMEEADETLKDAQKNGIDIPEPVADVSDDNVESQIVDVKNDIEYETFIDKLKQKTINKIVSDVTKIISDKKEENNMAFNPKPDVATESVVSVSVDYLMKNLWNESAVVSNMQEEITGMAIRESTLNMMDIIFKQPNADLRNISSRIRLGKGVLINESAVNYLIESSKSQQEINGVVDDAKKEFDNKIDSKLKASDVIKPGDNEDEDKPDKNK